MKKNKGFTLIELLLVISIISFLSSIVLASLNSAREKAGVTSVLEQIRQVRLAMKLYGSDMEYYPQGVCLEDCVQAGDPFLNNLTGCAGWNGPYLSIWDMTHYWGGHVSFIPSDVVGFSDWDADGILECTGLFLNDDRPQTNGGDDGGRIPTNILLELDAKLDDGNLATGNVRGDGNGWMGVPTEVGELVIVMGCY